MAVAEPTLSRGMHINVVGTSGWGGGWWVGGVAIVVNTVLAAEGTMPSGLQRLAVLLRIISMLKMRNRAQAAQHLWSYHTIDPRRTSGTALRSRMDDLSAIRGCGDDGRWLRRAMSGGL